jgi:succinate-semialdehyde dehydrogenase/glutarate-semialdehyde dehydrogenase
VKKEYLAKIITLEMGKLIAQAEGEILLSADILIIMPRTPRNF